MTSSNLLNFVTADYMSEREMNAALDRWNASREEFLPRLKANGLLRFTILKIWNKEGVYRLGFNYEYKDAASFNACRDIFFEIERVGASRHPVKIFANRGVVLEDNDLKDG